MAGISWDPQGDAQAALRAIVSDPQYGAAALSSSQTMTNLLKDLLPDAPREASVLVAASEAGLVGTLQEHVRQGLDLGTASRLAAGSFESRTALTTEACSWVVGALATALGMSAPPTAQPGVPAGGGAGTPQGAAPPGDDKETMTAGAEAFRAGPGAGYRPAAGPGYGPAAGPGYGPAAGPGYGPAAGPGYGPGPGPGRPPGRTRGSKLWVAGAAVIAVVVVVVLVSLNHKPSPPPSSHSSSSPSPSLSSSSPAVAAVTSLSQLLPSDTAKSTCKAAPHLSSPGVVSDYFCNTTSPDNIGFDAYQFDNPSDYAAGLNTINTDLGWNPSGAGTSCPPTGSTALTGWHSPVHPELQGQILECFTGKTEGPLYLWTLPTERVVYFAGGYSSAAAFNALQTWWHNYG